MKRVEVHWDDAWAGSHDYTLSEGRKLKPHPTKSVGLLVKHDDKVCVIAQSRDKDHVSEVLVIPSGMVTLVKELG